jgi:hypothetical protein
MVGPVGVRNDGWEGCGSAYCSNCAADLTHLPPVARYCHRCGFHLPADVADRVLPGLPERVEQCAVPYARLFFPPSLILLAYGKALFNLGFRYETAIGSRRNQEEALRCYGKAARLGDPSAVGRLAEWEGCAFAHPAPNHPAPDLAPPDHPSPPPLPSIDNPSHPPVAPPPLSYSTLP